MNRSQISVRTDTRPAVSANPKLLLSIIILWIFLIGIIIFLIHASVSAVSSAASEAYDAAKDVAASAIEQEFYDRSYDYSYDAHHVSNDIEINIDSIREQDRLEVLNVSSVVYEVPNKSSASDHFLSGILYSEVWFSIPGNGIFAVDLQAAEFITDSEQQYVLIRVPAPELFEFSIDYNEIKILYYNDGIFDHSAAAGESTAYTMLQTAEEDLIFEITSNQDNYLTAQENTRTMLSELVKQLNPELSDLTVEIEFF